MNKQALLKEFFGHDKFRDGQEELIDSILSGRDALGIMPTGAGKSVCYQIPALMLQGITIVISPLISLMHDQVTALNSMGIHSAYINSSLTSEQYERVIRNARAGEYKIIYVAPERLETGSFLNLCSILDVSLVAVDEAHCVSQWGQDFRPGYLNILTFINELKARPIVAAFTATATPDVANDIIEILKLQNPFRLTTGFDRPNLYFGVIKPQSKYPALVSLLSENEGKSGIIYCSTRKNVDELCRRLGEDGFSCAGYHAGMSDADRRKNQEDFVFDKIAVIVATNAFGMGIDKSNVSFVIHYNMPKSPEAYYQEAGRAGRDGMPARCIILYSGQDVRINTLLLENGGNSQLDAETAELVRKRDEERLRKMTFYCTTAGCLRGYLLAYFGEKSAIYCGNCSNCNAETEVIDITVDTQKIISCICRMKQNFGAVMVTDVLKGSASERVRKQGFTSLSTYGIMKEKSIDEIREIIEYLELEGYIYRYGEYHVLKVTEKSSAILKGTERLMMKHIKKQPRSVSKPFEKAKKYDTQYGSVDLRLLEQLKQLRLSLAKKENLPAYMVFSDSTLRDMCRKLPQTKTEFERVDGVGKLKLDKYSEYFVSLIKLYIKTNHKPDYETRQSEMNGVNEMSEKSIFEFLAENKDKLNVTEPTTLTNIIESFLNELGVFAKTRTVFVGISDWLVSEGWLSRAQTKGKKLILSERSDDFGISYLRTQTQSGVYIDKLIYNEKAQRYIINNIDLISEFVENKK